MKKLYIIVGLILAMGLTQTAYADRDDALGLALALTLPNIIYGFRAPPPPGYYSPPPVVYYNPPPVVYYNPPPVYYYRGDYDRGRRYSPEGWPRDDNRRWDDR